MRRLRLPLTVRKKVAAKKGILLDISFGGTPQPRSLTLGPNGDIRHNPTRIPFPLPNACVNTCVVTHVLEYIEPSQWYAWWDELHRVMMPTGIVYLSGPYGGDESIGWLSDPSHRTRVVEDAFAWLDPRTPVYTQHDQCGRETPKPWLMLSHARIPGPNNTISYNITLASQQA